MVGSWLAGFSPAGLATARAGASDRASEVTRRSRQAGVPVRRLGRAGGDRLVVDGLVDVSVEDAVRQWRSALPRALGLEPSGDRDPLPQVVEH